MKNYKVVWREDMFYPYTIYKRTWIFFWKDLDWRYTCKMDAEFECRILNASKF